MKVFLLHRDADLDVHPGLRDSIFEAMLSGDLFAVTNARRNLERTARPEEPAARRGGNPHLDALAQDLELETLWQAMANGDEFLYETAKRVTLSSLADVDSIRYRQQVLADCLEHRETILQLYALAMEALEAERKIGGLWVGSGADLVLSRSVRALGLHVSVLRRLRQLAEREAAGFRSDGFRRFFAMLEEELSEEYLATVERHLGELAFKHGLLESAELGRGNKATRYVVRARRARSWADRLVHGEGPPGYGFRIPPRDENGFKALEAIRARGIAHMANAVAQSAAHVKSFFAMLRLELAFYLGCVCLQERLEEKGEPVSFPEPLPPGEPRFACEGLYDVCLAFHLDGRVVGNDVDADGKSLVVVTGANQGGKSTFLRSAGLAQLMLQAGMFAGAESLHANVCRGLFTHFKREEDEAMEGGKLDEELRRMSEIADEIERGCVLLCNESFASTNEREGSEIARQAVRALLEREVKVFFVTHMYDLAHGFAAAELTHALFLRPERRPDGGRTFRLREGEPLPTSYGADSYRRIFADRTATRTHDSLPRR